MGDKSMVFLMVSAKEYQICITSSCKCQTIRKDLKKNALFTEADCYKSFPYLFLRFQIFLLEIYDLK